MKEKITKKQVDKVWADCVKARAGYKSEISGKTENLHAHHLRGKSSYRLRYELENGVCCTSGEHFFGFHVTGRREGYEKMIAAKRRPDLFEYLERLQWDICKTKLPEVYEYLKDVLGRIK